MCKLSSDMERVRLLQEQVHKVSNRMNQTTVASCYHASMMSESILLKINPDLKCSSCKVYSSDDIATANNKITRVFSKSMKRVRTIQ